MKQETSAGVGEDKDLLIKRLVEFDDVTRHYLYVLDQMNEALTRGAGTEEIKKIAEEMNTQSSKFESFSDLTEVFSSAKETVDNKISVLKDRIREKKEENNTKSPTGTETPEDLFIVNAQISYQGEDYKISETPNEKNKNKYILVHPTGKPIYKLTREQLFKQIENGSAVLVPPTPEQTTEANTDKTPEQILDIEKRLDDTRAKYAEEYKKFLAGAGKITRAKRFIFGEKIEDSKIPPELKELEKEYEKATVEYGNAMFSVKKTELEKSTLSLTDKDNELKRYKQNEIFNRVIVEEQSRLNALKAENLPPKEKNILKKGLDWYIKQERPTRIAISFALSAGFAFTVLPSSVAAAGGSLAYLGVKTARTFVGLGAGQGTAKLYDLIFKDKSAEKKQEAQEKLAVFFGKDEVDELGLGHAKTAYEEILEKEQKSKRNRLIGKAMASMVVGGAASLGTGYGMGQILHPSTGNLDASGTKSEHLKAKIGAETPESIKTDSTTIGATETIKPDETAIIQKGEGIEHAFRRQIDNNPELAKSLGFRGDASDTKALHEFSGGAAHKIAMEHGYVDKVTGEEIWVRPANEVAYQLKLENGELKVDELKLGSGLIEEHGPGSQFEKDIEKYEYKHPRPPHEVAAPTPEPPVSKSDFHIKGNPYSETPESFHLGDKAYPPVHKFETENFPEKVEVSRVDTHTDVEAARARVIEKMSTPNNTIRTGTRIGVGWAVEPGRGPGGTNYFWDSRFQNMNMGGPQYYFPGLSPDENDFLNNHPEFANNPFHLDDETLVRALKVHGHNVEHIFKDRDEWENFSNLKAKNWVHFGKIDEDSDPKLIYLNKLATITGIKPRGLASLHLRAETNGEYIARALQKAAEIGKLDQLKIKG
jgi:hypothetical protein